MRRAILLVCLAVVAGYGLTAVYKVEPKCAKYSGWTDTLPGRRSVSEVLTLNVDSLGPPAHTQLFVGLQQGSGDYEVQVKSYPGGVYDLAHGSASPPGSDHQWVTFNLTVDHPDSFVKGKRYEFRFQRGSSRLHFYYNYCATRYDSMAAAEELDSGTGRLRIA
jgi:hypothetical protein